MILDSSSFTVSTCRVLHIVDSDSDEQPLPVATKQIHWKYTSDTEENDDEEDAAEDEDNGEDLQDLPASQLEATLQKEVKVL